MGLIDTRWGRLRRLVPSNWREFDQQHKQKFQREKWTKLQLIKRADWSCCNWRGRPEGRAFFTRWSRPGTGNNYKTLYLSKSVQHSSLRCISLCRHRKKPTHKNKNQQSKRKKRRRKKKQMPSWFFLFGFPTNNEHGCYISISHHRSASKETWNRGTHYSVITAAYRFHAISIMSPISLNTLVCWKGRKRQKEETTNDTTW